MRRIIASVVLFFGFASALAGNSVAFGPGLTQCLAPTADSATSAWTVTGAASHFDAVNDAPRENCLCGGSTNQVHDGDTTYIFGPGSTACSDTFDVANTSGLSGMTILYVTVTSVCKKSSGTTNPALTIYARIGGVDYTFGGQSCTSTSYAESTSFTKMYVNPATSLAWTTSDIDALQLKIDRSNASARDAYVTAVGVVVAYEQPRNYSSVRERSGGGN